MRQGLNSAEAIFHGQDCEILYILTIDALRYCDMAQCFAVAAIKSKSYANLLLIITGNFKTIRAPSQIGLLDTDLSIVFSAFMIAGMALKKKGFCRKFLYLA